MTSDPSGKAIGLAEHYLDVGQPERALDALAHVHPDDVDFVWELRARALIELERWDDAADAARESLADEPDDAPVLALLAYAEWKLDNAAEAERAVLAALEQAPDSPPLLSLYAHIVASEGQLEKAERLVERALRLAPEDSDVRRTAAEIAYLQGRDSEADRHSRDALALDPEDAHAHALLGVTAAERGRVRPAAGYLRTAAELDPAIEHHARAARLSEVAAHLLLIPLWPISRFGQGPVWIAGVLTLIVTNQVAPSPIPGIVIIVWLAYVAYSWIAPPLLERWLERSRS
jgi:tetratricopeptide (TPR) repeat protein